jgi:hypothetical protein
MSEKPAVSIYMAVVFPHYYMGRTMDYRKDELYKVGQWRVISVLLVKE